MLPGMRRPGLRLALLLLATPGVARAGDLPPDPAAARAWLATVRPSADLQRFLDRTVDDLASADPALRRAGVRIALVDLSRGDPPQLAERDGRVPVYPASVVKFVYLMAAYAWQAQGRLQIDAELDDALTHMIRESSNQATQQVFARLTGTAPGPELSADAYRDFRDRRLGVLRWVRTLGVDGVRCVNPTYDGDGDLVGRDRQFVADRTVEGVAPDVGDPPNRNAMTAVGTAELLALLATDRALSPADSATVRGRMRRNPAEQPHLVHRLAGGAARQPGLEVDAKSGTWGPIYADAGIVRSRAGGQLVLVVFTEHSPPYRGDFIADLTQRVAARLLGSPAPAH
jgi:hypothetical protein